jgi:hypothetical protein
VAKKNVNITIFMDEEIESEGLLVVCLQKSIQIFVALCVGFAYFCYGLIRVPYEFCGCVVLFSNQLVSLKWASSLTKFLELLFQPILTLFFVSTLPMLHMCKAFSDNLNPPQVSKIIFAPTHP